MFQPGEEGFDGAARMIDSGVLRAGTGRPVDAAYGVHVRSSQTPRENFAAKAARSWLPPTRSTCESWDRGDTFDAVRR